MVSPFQALIQAGRRLWERNLLAAGDGNLSLRLEDGSILITPSGVSKGFLEEGNFARLSLDGRILEGKPSSERLMHLEVYRRAPEARAVVHAHPPTAVAWTLAHPNANALPSDLLPEATLAAGMIPVAGYALPGSLDLAESVGIFIPLNRLLLMARHGALCWGESLEEAVGGMERVEHIAQMLLTAQAFGGGVPLPEEERSHLWDLRRRLGPKVF